jgi:translation initiation factor IF-2
MTVAINNLAEELGMSTKELRARMGEFGFDLPANIHEVEEDIANLVIEELTSDKKTAEVYDDLIDQERQKEIVKKQRKKTAGQKKNKFNSKERDRNRSVTINSTVEIHDTISVKELSEKTNISITKIIGELMKNGILANINQIIDFDTAQIVCDIFSVKLKMKQGDISTDDHLARNLEAILKQGDNDVKKERPPVVTIMGHVDHGKTKLLDYIRNANVVAKESGGITQHLGAYSVKHKKKQISFIDTPGHHTFTAMRARGAQITDIAILVVSADEGIKTQTKEAYNHIKDAGVPIIVAITKIDKDNANVDKVKGELAELGLQSEDWGGNTVTCPLSSITGEGVPNLLDMILLVAEMEHIKVSHERPAVATVLESHLDKSLGNVATILVNAGTFQMSDNYIVGSTFGRAKLLKNHLNKNVKKAYPSDPVSIAGLQELPNAGDILQVVKDEKTARMQSLKLKEMIRLTNAANSSGIENIISKIHEGKLKQLKVIIKADTNGSLEALKQSLDKIESDQVAIKVIHSGVGNITENDVLMAAASEAVIAGLHVDAPERVKKIASQEKVQLSMYTVIYQLIDQLTDLLSGLLEPEIIEIEAAKLSVLKIFYTKKKEMIVGCNVDEGLAFNKARARVYRNDEFLIEGVIVSLQKGINTVADVEAGNECGIKFQGKENLKEGDKIVLIKEEQILSKVNITVN